MRGSSIVWLIHFASVVGVNSAPQLEKTDLFTAGQGGYATYRIPGIVVTAEGTLLAYCEGRSGGGDWSNQQLLLRRSMDGGQTWSQPRTFVGLPEPQLRNPLRLELREELGHAQTNSRTYHNCVMIPGRGRPTVHAIFCFDYWRAFYCISDDDGATFSAPREITEIIAKYRQKDWNWRVVGNGCGHGLQLENGRLLVPLWLSTSTQPRGHGHRPSQVGVIHSDDDGATWSIGDWAAKHSPPLLTPNETCAVQLVDGRTMFNIRHETKNHRRAIVTSPNGATDWSEPVFEEALFEPVCEASILRVSKKSASDRNRILFCNPDSRPDDPNSKSLKERRNLTLKLSYDEAKTWPVRKVVEPGAAGYSDLALGRDGTLYCFYERGSTDGRPGFRVASLTLARFNLEWLEDEVPR